MAEYKFNVNIPSELISEIADKVSNSILPKLTESTKTKEPEPLMTRHEVAEMLKIDISTVDLWRKKGKLKDYGIGHRVYFKRSEVEESLVRLNHGGDEN